MRIPDIIEQKEAAAESAYDRMHVDDGHYRCDCGAVTPNDEMNFPHPDPYSPPCCDKCMDKVMDGWEAGKELPEKAK